MYNIYKIRSLARVVFLDVMAPSSERFKTMFYSTRVSDLDIISLLEHY